MVLRGRRHLLRAGVVGRGVRAGWGRGTSAGSDSPDQAVFYTSGKHFDEAAFAYQRLFARAFGTNNLSYRSNMCH